MVVGRGGELAVATRRQIEMTECHDQKTQDVPHSEDPAQDEVNEYSGCNTDSGNLEHCDSVALLCHPC